MEICLVEGKLELQTKELNMLILLIMHVSVSRSIAFLGLSLICKMSMENSTGLLF